MAEEVVDEVPDGCSCADAPRKPHAVEDRWAQCVRCWPVVHRRHGRGVLYEYDDLEVAVVMGYADDSGA